MSVAANPKEILRQFAWRQSIAAGHPSKSRQNAELIKEN